ncbi:unnamed protein product [marine sediment metagenome]|uniref:Uncharacterized protein n=1 Tax=marine sediment metagenome TaxID=412755 RepID=X0TKI4_9ZZZZ
MIDPNDVLISGLENISNSMHDPNDVLISGLENISNSMLNIKTITDIYCLKKKAENLSKFLISPKCEYEISYLRNVVHKNENCHDDIFIQHQYVLLDELQTCISEKNIDGIFEIKQNFMPDPNLDECFNDILHNVLK